MSTLITGRVGRGAEQLAWTALAVLTTALLASLRGEIDGVHVALAYLLIVLGASARGGRRLGLVLAFLCFFAFNYFFIPPYHTLVIRNPLDWLVLVAFLLTSVVATQLLHRAQARAEEAGQRAQEIDRLAALGAETLNAGRAEDAVAAIAHVVRSGLGVAACEVYLRDAEGGHTRCVARSVGDDGRRADQRAPDPDLMRSATAGFAAARRTDGTAYEAHAAEASLATRRLLSTDARSMFIPLRVRDRQVGILRLESDQAITLDAAQQRFAEALAYYAALALERLRLTAAAEHAEALREADQLKDALLASVSHDLRTPLTTIKALAHDLAVEGDQRAVVIEEEADRLNRFVSDLLDLSRLNAGALTLEPELVAAEDVLGAALQQLSGAVAGRTINATLDATEPLLVGRFHFVETLRALVNLVENAVKYSPDSCAVDVSVRREGDWLAFEVADRGPGVPAEDRERIFEPFFRGSRSAGPGGTGLGLPIARRSVELQGGSLEFASRSGGGSVFTLRLPAVDTSELDRMSL
jgi:two-component system, OmpR family, sensor histidine kinase KdpD